MLILIVGGYGCGDRLSPCKQGIGRNWGMARTALLTTKTWGDHPSSSLGTMLICTL
ncbi:MAG: hypothetical protein ACFCBU_06200 [Cyanophyceae cyanobacterium]